MSPEDDLPAGWRQVAFDEIDSTNAEALRRATAGERGPLWITARHQTRGRGRSGRAWVSADTGIAATLLMSPRGPVSALPGLSLLAGVAAHQAITAMLPDEFRRQARIKWPNDVLIGGAKVSGILVESAICGEAAVVAIGTGINITAPPSVSGRDTTALAEHGAGADPLRMSLGLARALAGWLAIWADGAGFAAVRQAWIERAGEVGEPMTVNATERVEGRYAGLDADGGLMLRLASGELRKFSFGDVALGVTRV